MKILTKHKRKLLLFLSLLFIIGAIFIFKLEKSAKKKKDENNSSVSKIKEEKSIFPDNLIDSSIELTNHNKIYSKQLIIISKNNTKKPNQLIVSNDQPQNKMDENYDSAPETAIIVSNTESPSKNDDELLNEKPQLTAVNNNELVNTIEVSESDAGYKLNKAILTLKAGDTIAAIEQMSAIANENKKFVAVWHNLSICYLQQRDKAKAVRSLTKLEKIVFNNKTRKKINQVIDRSSNEDFEGALKILKELKAEE
jgi:tetratricopeptide (TPR) repeat protein